MLACGMRRSQQLVGKWGLVLLSMAMKWFLYVYIASAAGLVQWCPGDTSWYGMLMDVKCALNSVEISLSSQILLAWILFLVRTAYDSANPLTSSSAFQDLMGVAWM